MIVAEHLLLRLLTDYSDIVSAPTCQLPLSPEADLLVLAILRLVDEYEQDFVDRGLIGNKLNECRTHIRRLYDNSPPYIPHSWAKAEELPLILALNAIQPEDQEFDLFDIYSMLGHGMSDIRRHCFNVFWFFKLHTLRDLAVFYLFRNLTDTLGYVGSAAGIARALFPSDTEFFAAAARFKPPEEFTEQFADRIKWLEEDGVLKECQNNFLPLEIKVRQKIESITLRAAYHSHPSPVVQLNLPVDLTPSPAFPQIQQRNS